MAEVAVVYDRQTRQVIAVHIPAGPPVKHVAGQLETRVSLEFYKQFSSIDELAKRLPVTAPFFDVK
jgi:hypothetical protein